MRLPRIPAETEGSMRRFLHDRRLAVELGLIAIVVAAVHGAVACAARSRTTFGAALAFYSDLSSDPWGTPFFRSAHGQWFSAGADAVTQDGAGDDLLMRGSSSVLGVRGLPAFVTAGGVVLGLCVIVSAWLQPSARVALLLGLAPAGVAIFFSGGIAHMLLRVIPGSDLAPTALVYAVSAAVLVARSSRDQLVASDGVDTSSTSAVIASRTVDSADAGP